MDLLSEILVDLAVELHSILRTRLPFQWDFFRINQHEGLNIILNNVTYFTVYIAFLVWFVTAFISRVQGATSRRLETKDKCLAAVLSMVSAMYLLWPFLIFLTFFFTCEFYPWTTAVFVCLLNIHSFATSQKMLCLNIPAWILDSKDYVKRMVSFRTRDEPRNDHESFEEDSISSTEERNVRESEIPDYQPGLLVNNGYTPFEHSEIEPVTTPDDHPGPSQTPAIQPKFTTDKPYISSGRPKTQPRLTSDDQLILSQTPTAQSNLTGEEHYRPSDRPRIQPRVVSKKTLGSNETPGIQPQSSGQPQSQHKHSKMKPRKLTFESESEETDILDDSEDSSSETLTGNSTSSEHPKIRQKNRDKNSGQKNDFWKFEYEKVDDLISYEDFQNQMHLNSTRIKTSSPKNSIGKGSKENTTWSSRSQSGHNGLRKDHNKSYCSRCWKMVNQSFHHEFRTFIEPHTTRLGTIYGPPNIFCQCNRLQRNMEH